MKEIEGNIWQFHHSPNLIVIPTNGSVRKDGACVMGRGLALQAKRRYHQFPYDLGTSILNRGNYVYLFSKYGLVSFPVKHTWYQKADLILIKVSISELRNFFPWQSVYLPEVGCGNGGLDWKEVKPLLEGLPDNFTVVHYKYD